LGLPRVAPHDRWGEILVIIGEQKIERVAFFIKNASFVRLIYFLMVIFQNVLSPKAAGWTQESFWRSGKSGKSQSRKVRNLQNLKVAKLVYDIMIDSRSGSIVQ